ncbi:MAG: hypothetical protein QXN56_03965, partial [Candidatus Hadarchaeum sp.]
MSERPESIRRLSGGVPVAALDRQTLSYVEITDSEREAIDWVLESNLSVLKKVSPTIASDIASQKQLVYNLA